MTIQELIDELEDAPDKNRPAKVCLQINGSASEILPITGLGLGRENDNGYIYADDPSWEDD